MLKPCSVSSHLRCLWVRAALAFSIKPAMEVQERPPHEQSCLSANPWVSSGLLAYFLTCPSLPRAPLRSPLPARPPETFCPSSPILPWASIRELPLSTLTTNHSKPRFQFLSSRVYSRIRKRVGIILKGSTRILLRDLFCSGKYCLWAIWL